MGLFVFFSLSLLFVFLLAVGFVAGARCGFCCVCPPIALGSLAFSGSGRVRCCFVPAFGLRRCCVCLARCVLCAQLALVHGVLGFWLCWLRALCPPSAFRCAWLALGVANPKMLGNFFLVVGALWRAWRFAVVPGALRFGMLLAQVMAEFLLNGNKRRSKIMEENLVRNIQQAAKLLGCNQVTVHRMIKRGEFPKPVEEFAIDPEGQKIVRIWKKSDLLALKPKMRSVGNPNLTKKTKSLPN